MESTARNILILLALWISCVNGDSRYLVKEHADGKEYFGKNFTVMEGESVILSCGSRLQKPSFGKSWFASIEERKIAGTMYRQLDIIKKRFGQRAVLIRGGRYYSGRPERIDQTFDIKLHNISRYIAGRYKCIVVSLISKRATYAESTDHIITVKSKPKIESKKEANIKIKAREKLNMDCISSGFPKPLITWRRVDGRPLPARKLTHSTGLLSISDVGQQDRGDYECTSTNIYGRDTKIYSVDMTVPPRFISTGDSFATVGKDGIVACVAVGLPRPKFSWRWDDKGYEQRLSSAEGLVGRYQVKTKHYFENSTSYLMIKNVEKEDLRSYRCMLGKDDKPQEINLRRYTRPSAPIIQTVVSYRRKITLSWKLAETKGGKPVTSMTIQYKRYNTTSQFQKLTIPIEKRPVYTITGLRPNTEYHIQLIAVNEIGPSDPSVPVVERTGTASPSTAKVKAKETYRTVLYAGVAGGFLVLIIAIIVVCIFMRQIQRNSAKKAAENAQRLAGKSATDDTTALIHFLQKDGDHRIPTNTGSGIGVVLHLTTSNKWEFPRERLVLQNVLGSGAFGIVMKAEAEGISGSNSGSTPVAVKFVKENESASSKKDLIAELELLKLIEPHKNVINLMGCCTKSEPLMVIVEFCAYGDLQSFLRASRGVRDQYYLDCYKRPSSRLTSNELLMFGTQIARGMAHLANLKVIHRDLAARNILVDENKICKVSDFGFARDIYVEDHYTRKTAGGRFPIKWMAIESLLDGISTTKSDVWSFAIVLWEIITLGASPYPGMNSQEVVSFLQNGMRMDKPKHCSDELYNLLMDCWHIAPHRRPNFEMLARYLDRMCNDDFEYINMRTYDDHLYINFDGNTVSEGSKSGSLTKQNDYIKDDENEKEALMKDNLS